MNKIFISLEGNIGAGKSTLMNIVSKQIQNVQIISEPLQEWQNIQFQNKNLNILDHFYRDPHRWCYSFQTYCFFSRHKNLLQIMQNDYDHNVFVLERSIFSDKYIFADLSYKKSFLNDLEWALYNIQFDYLQSVFSMKLHGMIYIKTSPQTSYARILKRQRNEENNIEFNYLEELHQQHENWLLKKPNVLILDADRDFEFDLTHQQAIVKQIQEFILNIAQK